MQRQVSAGLSPPSTRQARTASPGQHHCLAQSVAGGGERWLAISGLSRCKFELKDPQILQLSTPGRSVRLHQEKDLG